MVGTRPYLLLEQTRCGRRVLRDQGLDAIVDERGQHSTVAGQKLSKRDAKHSASGVGWGKRRQLHGRL